MNISDETSNLSLLNQIDVIQKERINSMQSKFIPLRAQVIEQEKQHRRRLARYSRIYNQIMGATI
jgi:hypothetical protein